MIRSRFVRSATLVLATFATISCADYSPTGPSRPLAPSQTEDGLISGLVGVVTNVLGSVIRIIDFQYDPNGIPVYAVRWSGTHTNQVRTVSGYVGYDGGSLAIPGSDFTITFPKGALSSTTLVSITSDGNGYVSYDMKPHGIKFAKPVLVTQLLKNTAVYKTPTALNSFGAYFPQDPTLLGGLLKALEIEKTTIYSSPNGPQAEVQVWELNHFSRYMLASD
jgi:hypothetical protein